MASADLARLWRVHEIDAALVDIRAHAGALDPGTKLQQEIAALTKHLEEKGGEAKALAQEQIDLELAQKSLQEKLKKNDRELYGGSLLNSREVEARNREMEMIKNQRDSMDERLLELMELVPPAKALAEKIQKRIDEKKAELAEFRKGALAEKSRLEEEFRIQTAKRPQAIAGIAPGLLARYDDIRKKSAGIGMARITREQACGACGMALPERSVQNAKDDKVVTCEACHRILYYSESIL
jgi:hypothetical protein